MRIGDQHDIGSPACKQTDGHHARPLVDLGLHRQRIADSKTVHIENRIAVVADETFAQARHATQLRDRPCHLSAGHRDHFDRQRKATQHIHQLGPIDNAHEALGNLGDDLFPSQRPAATLDQRKLRVHLVCAVNIDRQRLHGINREHGDALFAQQLAASL